MNEYLFKHKNNVKHSPFCKQKYKITKYTKKYINQLKRKLFVYKS